MYKQIVVHIASPLSHMLDFRWITRRTWKCWPLGNPSEPLPSIPRISSLLYLNLQTKRQRKTGIYIQETPTTKVNVITEKNDVEKSGGFEEKCLIPRKDRIPS